MLDPCAAGDIHLRWPRILQSVKLLVIAEELP